jgi:CelD/BcsL family acetyltransferase involved in cellulose biosynthesis
MRYRWVEDIKEFQDIAEKWDRALILSGSRNPFLLSDFITTWWKHYGRACELRIFMIYDNDKIAGGIPLYVRRGGLNEAFTRVLSHVGGAAANYTEPFYVSSDIKFFPMFTEALAEKKDWDSLHLTHVRPENKLISEYKNSLSDRRFFLYPVQDHMNWAIDLSMGKDNYYEETISKKLMRDLRAKRKHAVKDYGQLRLKEIKGKIEVERYFDLYTDFSLDAFSRRKRISSFRDKKYAAFLKEFLVIMDSADRLDGHVLLAGDNVLAISFAYRFGKGFNWVLTGFDYKYKYVRPGYLLIEELIKEICNRGETYYNWYGHARFYKAQWCNTQSPLFQIFLVKRTLKGLCYNILKQSELTLRSNEKFMNLIRNLRRC